MRIVVSMWSRLWSFIGRWIHLSRDLRRLEAIANAHQGWREIADVRLVSLVGQQHLLHEIVRADRHDWQSALHSLTDRVRVCELTLRNLELEQQDHARQVQAAVVTLVDEFNRHMASDDGTGRVRRLALPHLPFLPATLPDERECDWCHASVTIWHTLANGRVRCTDHRDSP